MNVLKTQRMVNKSHKNIGVRVRGAIHEHSITKLNNLHIYKPILKNVLNSIHQHAVKVLVRTDKHPSYPILPFPPTIWNPHSLRYYDLHFTLHHG